MNMTEISTHMILLGDDPMDFEKPTLESKTGILDIKENNIIQIKHKLYEVTRTRTTTKVQSGIKLNMQFIYVQPISTQRLLTKIRDTFQ